MAGELLRTELVDAIYDLDQVEQVWDLYGPSEDTTYSTFTLRWCSEPPCIGRPLADTSGFVQDRDVGLSPTGASGELWLESARLARCYLGRPALTAEKFGMGQRRVTAPAR